MRAFAGFVTGIVVLTLFIPPAFADDLQVSIVSITSQVTVGQPITLVVQTEPKASCEVALHWRVQKGGPGTTANLRQRVANAEGKAEWTWNAPKTANMNANILVTCKLGDKSGQASTLVKVQ